MNQTSILIVDDEKAVRTALNVNLRKRGLQVVLAASAKEALVALGERAFDLVLSDVKMPDGTGLDLLKNVRSAWPDTQVVIMTGYGSIVDAVTAIKEGAADYIIKPIEQDELFLILERALERRNLRSEVRQLRAEITERYGFHNLVGTSSVMQDLYAQIASVAETSATVLLEGPTGTGKELLAHAIHYRSQRARSPFVRINCATLPEHLLESELFGHERGAFSGAIRQHLGKFEQANGGTILLDEIGEVDIKLQAKLLRVLENGEMQRVGGSRTIALDVRVITSTNRDLKREAREGRFRQDLYYRLNVVTIRVPPLKDRREDIPLLVDHFLGLFHTDRSVKPLRASPEQVERLMAYDWPGNVRELKHTIERAVVLHRGGDMVDITVPTDLSSDSHSSTAQRPEFDQIVCLADALATYERSIIIDALKAANGVQAQAARSLGLSRSNLNYRIQKLGITVKEISYD